MTVEEIYEQVRSFTPTERAQLIELIERLDPEPPCTAHNEDELEAMLLEGIEGPFTEVTSDTWSRLRQRVANHPNPKQ